MNSIIDIIDTLEKSADAKLIVIMLTKDLKNLPRDLDVEIIDSMPGGANDATTVIR